MRSRSLWIVVATGIGGGLCWLAFAAAKPQPGPPIVLQFHDTPLFLGPHEHSVVALAYSPDGQTLATGANDGYLRLWDSATGRLKSIHADDRMRGPQSLAFSPAGQTLAAVGMLFGLDALLWDTATGRVVKELAEQPAAAAPAAEAMIYKGQPIVLRTLHAVAYSPNGRILATAGDAVVLRDAQTGAVITALKHSGKKVKSLAFSADGKTLATAGDDMQVRLWSLPNGALEATLEGPTQPLSGIAIAPGGLRIVATSSGNRSLLSRDRTPVGYLWAWDRASGPARKIEVGNTTVRQVAFVSPTTVVLAAGRDVLSVDLAQDGAPRPRKIWSHSADVLTLAVSPDRRLVASGSADRTVDVVDIATGKLAHRLPGLNEVISAVAVAHDGQRFATSTLDSRFSNRLRVDDESFSARYKTYFSSAADAGRMQPSEIRVWSTPDGRLQSLLPIPACQVTAIKFIPRGEQLVVAGWIPGKNGFLSVWDVNTGQQLRELATPAAEVLAIALSADGRALASGDAEGNLALWDVPSARQIRSHKHDHPLEAVALSADGKLVATGASNQTARLFDIASGAITRTLQSRSYIESLEFSPDGTLLVAGTRHPGIEVWDLRKDTASRTLKASGDYFDTMPGYVAFSADGRFVACGGHGKDIAIFDVAKETLHCELRGHIHASTAAAFLPDGRLISGGEERTTRLWDLGAGKWQATWVAMPADPQQNWGDEWVGFTPTGQFVSSARWDRLVGWMTGGDVVLGSEDGQRRRRVASLFPATP